MNNRILYSFVTTLLCLPSCSSGLFSSSQTVQTTTSEDIESVNEQVALSPKVRHEDILQLQIDASSVYSEMINYFTPDEELFSPTLNENLTAYINYPAGSVSINPRYGNNSAELQKMKEQLSRLLNNTSDKVKSIHLRGFASPDGTTVENERLAGNRTIQFKNYLLKILPLTDKNLITIDWSGEDWDGLKEMISQSSKGYKTKVLAILESSKDPDQKRKLLKLLDNGTVYKDIEKTFFSRLRRMQLTVEYQMLESAYDNPVVNMIYTDPDKLSMSEMFRIAGLFRPGTEQYREVYEIIAYTYPSCAVAQLNAAAGALALGDKESARFFLQQVDTDVRSYNNAGVLALMDGDKETAAKYFRKATVQNPRLSRKNLNIIKNMGF